MTTSLYRDKSRGEIAGVCAGLADYFGVSPILLRFIFVFMALAGGPGVLLYIILWIVLPDKSTLTRSRQEVVRENVYEIGAEARSLGRDLQGIFGGKGGAEATTNKRLVLLGGLIILMGVAFLLDNMHLLGWFRLDQLWPVVLILAGIVLLKRALRG
jgi:phage shock protein C